MSINVTDIDTLKPIIDQMFITMFSNNGVGLAAPQIGINVNLFIMNQTKDTINNKVFINPKLILNGDIISDIEGCLSFPNVFGKIKRYSNVEIGYLNTNNKVVIEQYTGLQARIIQHEYDHLIGINFIDKMSKADLIKNNKLLN
jgi:peptide deformylase